VSDSAFPQIRVEDLHATVSAASEYGSDRPCEVGRITYRIGCHDYIALAFRYTDGLDGERLPWFLTWVGESGHEPGRLPVGVEPTLAMLNVLEAAPVEGL
jgi:hypothetical protein